MIALDLFAGHGWGVACRRLDIEEHGVEIMPEAVATREANGMHTIYRDVWEGLENRPTEIQTDNVTGTGYDGKTRNRYRRSMDAPAPTLSTRVDTWQKITHIPDYEILIASPPCQTFSMAGSGAGRAALNDVLEAIRERAYLDPAALRAFGEKHDPRTALVLTPLAHVARDTPTYVVFEQVPPVLPVWEACADEMRRWGYSVWTGNLQAEMYGVPQTRKRAVLIARADGIEAAPPKATHSRYYSRDPKRLDEGVLPWVSMAEALGWAEDWQGGDRAGGGLAVGGSGARKIIYDARERGGFEFISNQNRVMRSNYSGGGAPGASAEERGRTMREGDKPSLAMTGKPGHWVRPSSRARSSMPEGASRITVAEAAALQSYPADFVWDVTIPDPKTGKPRPVTKTKQFLQVGNAVPPLLAEAILKGFLS